MVDVNINIQINVTVTIFLIKGAEGKSIFFLNIKLSYS